MRKQLVSLLCLAGALTATAADPKKSDLSETFFRAPSVPTLRVDLPADSLAQLQEGRRTYVRATVHCGSELYTNVGVRLKGHAGFQPVERKPSLTLKFNEFASAQEFHGLGKVMLNNCAQDASCLREVLASRIFHEAGLPVARVTHARVLLNGRELGLYALAEGMNKSFLKREFGHSSGNLYEGELKDIDERLTQENGDDDTQHDLQALTVAARAPLVQRLAKMRALMDVDEFASFLALEMLTASIDGYAYKKNNYRIYHQPKTDRLVFLPHGLDATFGSAGFQPPQNSVLVKALWELPDFQKEYRAKLAELGVKVWHVPSLTAQANALAARLAAAAPDRATALQITEEATKLRYQIAQQQQLLETELKKAVKP